MYSESALSRALPLTGTPNTGNVVFKAAVLEAVRGRCIAQLVPATITLNRRAARLHVLYQSVWRAMRGDEPQFELYQEHNENVCRLQYRG